MADAITIACDHCQRDLGGHRPWAGGPFLFCSPICRDLSQKLRDHNSRQPGYVAPLWTCSQCGGECEPDWAQLAKELRSRAGKGDDT